MESRKNCSFLSSLCNLDYEVKYNCRDKFYINSLGELVHLETMFSKRFIFNPDNVSLHNGDRIRAKEKWDKQLDEMYGYSGNYKSEYNSVDVSQRRAKRKIFDYILCNDFDVFATVTLDPKLIDNFDYDVAVKKLKNYLDNRVRRNGLFYVGVTERHKKGGLHFHFLFNSSALSLVDSGTVNCVGHKKPIKVSTADRLNVPFEDRKTVYNIDDWKLGFTTALFLYGDKGAVANYVGKYITKGNKVGGRWYFSGGKLTKPFYKYSRVSYNDVTDFSYDFVCDGGEFKVKKYENDN